MLLRLKEEPAELTEAQFPFIEIRVSRQHFSFDVRVASRVFSNFLEILKAPKHQIVGGTERLGLFRRLPCSHILRLATTDRFATADLLASRGPRRPPASCGCPTACLGFSRGSRIVG